MPRPNPAQLAYGSATVILSALAMLLLSQTRSGAGVTVVASAALALGLIVAVTVPAKRQPRRSRTVAGSAVTARYDVSRTEQRLPEASLRR